MGLFYDSTYLLVILAALISMAVSVRMNTIFSKYQTVRSYSGMTGREAAMRKPGAAVHSATGRTCRLVRSTMTQAMRVHGSWPAM